MRASTLLLAIGLSALFSCKSEEPPPAPKKVDKGVDVSKIPVPEHTAEMLSDPGKPRRVAAAGSLDATIGGKVQHFPHMPKGVNAAAWAEDTKVSWVRITALTTSEGGPKFQISLENVRLDELELPATFSTADTKGKTSLSVRFEIDPVKWWEAKAGSASTAEVTLQSFEGKRVTGTVKGVLDPAAPALGKPLEVTDGTFDVELRLSGVAEGKAANGPS